MNILYTYRGSKAHNLYIPSEEIMSTDDIDYIGVFINPLDYYFGLKRREHEEIKSGPDDIILYELKNFVSLLCKGNPNVMSVLWNKKEMYTEITKEGQMLLDNRDLFSSKRAYFSFGGYAKSQLKKMFSSSYYGYMGDKRKELVDRFGYDTKNASHLIRLLKQGSDFLSTGKLTVWCEGEWRQKLLNIKQGKWSIPQVKSYAMLLSEELDKSYMGSNLPNNVNKNKVDKLLVKIFEQYFYGDVMLKRSKK